MKDDKKYNKGVELLKAEKFDEALHLFNELLKEFPQNAKRVVGSKSRVYYPFLGRFKRNVPKKFTLQLNTDKYRSGPQRRQRAKNKNPG